jgi:signal transduction histidine kinase
LAILLPALPAGLGIGYATGRYLASLATSLVISATTYALFRLDIQFVHPLFRSLPPGRAVMMEILTGLIELGLGTWLAFSLCNHIFGYPFLGQHVFLLVGGTVLSIAVLHTFTYTMFSHAEMKRKIAEEERLRAMATEAELKALKAQINPHFLFNTLNTIAALIHSDPHRAESTVERLAEMFRYVLTGTERGLVPLREELSFVDGYLEIEGARFGERLCVARDVDLEALDTPVPGLILQPLVENAIRHGSRGNGQVDLTICIKAHGDEIEIGVADGGEGMPPGFRLGSGPGLGLYNVHQRLTRTYGEGYGVEIASNEPHGTVVTIRIPGGGGYEETTGLDR